MAETLRVGAPPPPEIRDLPALPDTDVAGDPDDDGLPAVLTEPIVRSLLEGCAGMASMLVNPVHVPGLWKFRPDELDQIVPPLTRIANRSEGARKLLLQGDWIALGLATGPYVGRNLSDWRTARELDRQDQQAAGGHGGRPGTTPADWRYPTGRGDGNGGPDVPHDAPPLGPR